MSRPSMINEQPVFTTAQACLEDAQWTANQTGRSQAIVPYGKGKFSYLPASQVRQQSEPVLETVRPGEKG